jgi:hypothetical protein
MHEAIVTFITMVDGDGTPYPETHVWRFEFDTVEEFGVAMETMREQSIAHEKLGAPCQKFHESD